jgi:hypothetical protein
VLFWKKKKGKIFFKLSDEAVFFIKQYLLEECDVKAKIDDDLLDEFVSIAFDWESSMVDENGNDKEYDYPDKERNEMADRFVSEVSGKLSSDLWVADLDDLNERLGLV